MQIIKKTKIALLATALVQFAMPAHADTSVMLSGYLDDALAYVSSNGGHGPQWGLSSGNHSTDAWSLSGSEDLGGGLAATFMLENQFDVNSGQALNDSRLFGSQAFVGLTSEQWGSLTLGRQEDPLSQLMQPITAQPFSGTYGSPGDIDNYDNSANFNNAIEWTSPSLGGVTLQGMYAFGGVAGSTGSGQSYSGAASYAHGPCTAVAGILHVDNGSATASTRGNSSSDSFFGSAVNQAYASARSIDIVRAGAQYVIGKVTLGGAYSFSEYNRDSASTFAKAEKYANGSVFAQWQATEALQLIAGYNETKSSGDSSAKYHQANLGADYALSKRTDMYAMGGFQRASGRNGLGAAQAVIGSYDIDSGKSTQALAFVGIRHKF